MQTKTFIATIAFLLSATVVWGQAKKPELMVVPLDAWCFDHGYTQTYDDQGTQKTIPDYAAAVSADQDLNNVIAKINGLMADRGFPLKDLRAATGSVNRRSSEMSLIRSKGSGAAMTENPLDRFRRTAKCDIILKVNWQVLTTGPKKSIRYSLEGIDAYTDKAVATAQGTGSPSFSSEIAVLLEEAVMNHMDNFTAQLQAHFDDLMQNGREVTVEVNVFDDAGVDMETEYEGYELSEIIDNWMAENTVNHRFSKAEASENFILFEQVRIPLYKQNGMAQDTEGFTRELGRFLRAAPYNLPSKIIPSGLGRCILIIGQK